MIRVALVIVAVILFLLFYNIGNVQADLKNGLVTYYSFNGDADDSIGINHGRLCPVWRSNGDDENLEK
jgi:nitrogen fixation-related uncharacterized protein